MTGKRPSASASNRLVIISTSRTDVAGTMAAACATGAAVAVLFHQDGTDTVERSLQGIALSIYRSGTDVSWHLRAILYVYNH